MTETYGKCPRKPEGFKWWGHQRSRYSSCGWGFDTFAETLAYLRQQYGHAVRHTKERRRPGDEYCEREFWATIEGPGGKLDWLTIQPLIKRSKNELG
jgi:hypothetical protein